MIYNIKTKIERHTRESVFEAHCVDCAPLIALSHAKAYEQGSGVYGPMAWRYGELSIWSLTTEPIVIRPKRPMLKLVT